MNCSGDNLEVDYHSAAGFCSADDLWIPFKNQDSPTCPYVDVLLIPGCEYEGTAHGQGQPKGVGYTFEAEAGNVYKVIFPGGTKLYVGEVAADERAATDTGGLDPNDPARNQPVEAADTTQTTMDSPQSSAPAAESSSGETQEMLPVSGQAHETPIPFMVAAIALILFLLVAGVVAARKRGQPA